MLIRLNKFISDSGCCSRRKADEFIKNGSVAVNGTKVSLGIKIDPKKDEVCLEGNKVTLAPVKVYYALYKPHGVISTVSDEKERQKVVDLVPKNPHVFPVGRLDAVSEGLIILTNDGDFAQKLSHPSFEHEKEYLVVARIINKELKIKGTDTEEIIKRRLLQGINIGKKLMKADKAKVTIVHDSKFIIQVVLHTGYNRQIRKMCAKIGLEVLKLTRIRIGKLSLVQIALKPGEFKQINPEEII